MTIAWAKWITSLATSKLETPQLVIILGLLIIALTFDVSLIVLMWRLP